MNLRYLKQLPIWITTLGLFAGTSDRKTAMQEYNPADCADLCWRATGLECDESWDINAGAIYFQARAQGVDIAVITQDRNNSLFPVNGIGVQPEESLWWGFKIGGGYKLFRQDWRLTLDYTFFNSVTNSELSTSYGSAFVPSIYNNQFIGVGIQQNFQLFNNLEVGTRNVINNVQLCATRPTYIDKRVELSPFYGLDLSFLTRRTVSVFSNDFIPGVTYQRYPTSGGGFYQTYQKWSWWGIGPCVGLATKWFLDYDISVYGDVYGSVNYGSSRCRVSSFSRPALSLAFASQTASSAGFSVPQEAVIDNTLFQFAPEFSYQLGFNWSKLTEEKDLLLQFNLGYEATYFFNIIKTVSPQLGYKIEDGAGIGIQGLVLQAFLDF
ncbi:MAG: Lpg1974 family pore-forming outer membrane protein [Chlamydiia bacterium]